MVHPNRRGLLHLAEVTTAYDHGTRLARDTILLTTVLSVPVLVTVAILLGAP